MTTDEEVVLKAFRSMGGEARVNAKAYMLELALRCPASRDARPGYLQLVPDTPGPGAGTLLTRRSSGKN
jgi:hypothetical protein